MKHITQEQRYTISVLLKAKKSNSEIARITGKDKSTIGRELKRNSDQRNLVYKSGLAQRKCMAPHSDKAKIVRFTDSVKHDVEEGFRSTYSPEQIAGRAVLERRDMVSHERICQHIWQDKKQGGELHEYLRTKGKHYRKREVR